MGCSTYPMVVYALLCVITLIELYADQKISVFSIPQVAAQNLPFLTDGSSKVNKLSSSKFRENIVQVQRIQQRPIQQQQIVSKAFYNEQQVIQPVQSVQTVEKQQGFNDLSLVQHHEDSQQSTFTSTNTESIYGSVQGKPGVDFPNYSSIPNTKFSCDGVPFEPGMYADESTGCQVYHLCYQGRRESFLCGVGTVFNQAILNCDFWHSVECSKSSLHYGVNVDFGKSVPEPGGNSYQSVSQTSIAQTEQTLLPVEKVHLQSVMNYRQSPIVQPVASKFVRKGQNFESLQQFSSGKISHPQQRLTSSFTSATTEENLAASQSTNRLRDAANVVITSPGRKAAQLNRAINGVQQITSAESSAISSLSIQAASTKTGKINLPATNLKSRVNQNQLIFMKQSGSIASPHSSLKSSTSLSKGNSFKSTKDQSLVQSEDQVWKPFFRNKGKASPGMTESELSSVPPAPVKQIAGATSEGSAVPNASTEPVGDTSTSARPDLPLPTVAQPNQEPTFSPIQNSQPPTANEVPSIPNKKAPPTTKSPITTTNEPSTETSPSANIESDVTSALSTTTSRPASETDEGSTTTSAKPSDSDTGTLAPNGTLAETTTTTTQTDGETSTQNDADSSKPTTTTLAEQTTTPPDAATPEVSMTTTMSPVSEPESTTQPDTTTTPDQESESTSDQAESAKRKRGAKVAGVEYADKIVGRKFENSSSVDYAAKRESRDVGASS